MIRLVPELFGASCGCCWQKIEAPGDVVHRWASAHLGPRLDYVVGRVFLGDVQVGPRQRVNVR